MADEGLRKAAQYILDTIVKAAPTEKSGASFRMVDSGGDVVITSADDGTIATEHGYRHPVYARGPRSEWTWTGPAGHQIGKKHFIDRAAGRAARTAQDRLGEDFARQVITDNAWLGYR